MTATTRPLLTRPSGEGELGWTIGISALIHVAGIAALALLPTRLPGPRPLESYTVDLVAPSAVGGTNLVAGRKKEAASSAERSQPQTSGKSEVVLPEPRQLAVGEPEAAKPPEPKPAAKVPEEKPKVEPVPPKPAAKPEAVAKAPEPPKPEPEPARVEAKKAAPKPAPAVEPEAPAKKAAPEKPAQQKVERESKPQPAAKPEAKPRQEESAAAKKPAQPSAKKEEASTVEQRIAAAVEKRANQLKREEGAPASGNEVDRRIAAAVERRARSVQSEGEGGGPVSYGPGTGSGGVVRGVAYILYRGHMEERIRAAWAWAGANRSLRAVVRFNIMANGDIVNVQIVTSSGDRTYDSSIERALRAASPLDPPPPEYREEFSTVELEFRPEDLQS